MNIFVTKSLYIFLCLTIIITISIFLTEQSLIHNYNNMVSNQENSNKIINYNLNKNKYSPVNKNDDCLNSINCNTLNYIYSRGNNNTYINYE